MVKPWTISMECQRGIMSNTVVCLPNFIGRLLGLRRIEFDGIYLRIVKTNTTSEYELREICAGSAARVSWMGGEYQFSTMSDPIRVRFLMKDSVIPLSTAIERAVTVYADRQIEALHRQLTFSAINQYLRDSHIEALEKDVHNTVTRYHQFLNQPNSLSIARQKELKLLAQITPLSSHSEDLRQEYEKKQLITREAFFSCVESNPLTSAQCLAVIRNNDRNLVLAAAGTGKTSVIVAKALDLIQTCRAEPSEVLILAYNNAAAKELQERISARANKIGTGTKDLPKIKTFHGLGRKILLETNITPTLSRFTEDRKALEAWATEWFVDTIKRSEHSLKMFIRLLYPAINPFSFKTLGEYEAYVRDNEYRTLKGEKVRGYQELLIANWLYLNCVDYEYEPSYITKRRISVGFDYRPDFYLTEADIYLEHFGIDKNGNTRSGIDPLRYQADMQAKRELHKEQNTVLIETYHYNWLEDDLTLSLERQLVGLGVSLQPRPQEDVLTALKEFGGISEGVSRYISCLQAIRVEQLSTEDIVTRLTEHEISNADEYADLLTAFHSAYVEVLASEGSIDFDDMIIRATDSTLSGKYNPKFKYILVDEFQDISKARMDFLNALIVKGPAPILTVVGDDWQSIYRFSGGKLELTTRFDEQVGSHTKTMLDKTFRYNNSIAHTAGTFVMANPEQYKKHIVTHSEVQSSQVFLLDDVVNDVPNTPLKTRQIVERIFSQKPDASIAIMARYKYLLNETKLELSTLTKRRNMKFWTLHSSKGLEADYCIIVGLTHGKLGFPNSRKDEIVVEALLPSLDPFPFSEERRLLYVAITRAKHKCYIVADASAPSSFVKDLLNPELKVMVASDLLTGQESSHYKCPSCSSGYLKKVNGQYGEFYSCSSGAACKTNLRVCEICSSPSVDSEKHSKCLNQSCNRTMPLCPVCGRPLKEVKSKYGKFIGCSGFGIPEDSCTYKRAL